MTYVEAGCEIAREAGALLVQCWRGEILCRRKQDFDVVTDADFAAEALILAQLRSRFPDHGIQAEESGAIRGESAYCWLVDPLDGTKNFSRRHPFFSVALALEHEGATVAGVIYDPLRDEMFSAERGRGAHLNGVSISVSTTMRLEDALLTTSYPSARRHGAQDPGLFYRLGMRSQGYRRSGSTALDLAYVACGRLDAFWDSALEEWDVAAGLLLIEEAGGSHARLQGNLLLADNTRLHEEIKSAMTG